MAALINYLKWFCFLHFWRRTGPKCR